jgi:hypothetical protein
MGFHTFFVLRVARVADARGVHSICMFTAFLCQEVATCMGSDAERAMTLFIANLSSVAPSHCLHTFFRV